MLLLILVLKLVIAGLLLGSSLLDKGRSFLFAYRKWFFLVSVLIIFVALVYISYLHYQFWNSNEFTISLNSDQSFGEELDRLGVKFAADYLDPIFRGINSSIKFLFSGYAGGTYLLFFLLTRLWGEYIISLIFALLFLWTMLFLNHKYESRFFYDEEPYFGAVAIFLTGWPGWLYYLIILLVLFLVFNAIATVIVNKKTHMVIAKSSVREIEVSHNFPPKADPPLAEGSWTSEEAPEVARFSLYYFWLPVAIAIILLMAYFQTALPYYNLLKI